MLVEERSKLEAALNAVTTESKLKESEVAETRHQLNFYRQRSDQLQNESTVLRTELMSVSEQLRSMSAAAEAKAQLSKLVEEQQTEIEELGR